MRRAGDQRHLGVAKSCGQIRGDDQRFRQLHPGEIVPVFPGQLHADRVLRAARDQRGRLAASREMNGHSGAPGTGTDNGELYWR